MNLTLIATHTVSAAQVSMDTLEPEFRKATLNMTLSALATKELLKKLPEIAKEEVSLILATHFGEVTSTLEFLAGHLESQTARPILFQNSLHNSTLGFVTIHLGLTGPAMTVSTDKLTVQAALTLAESLTELSTCVIVCFVDAIPQELTPHYLHSFPFLEEFLDKAQCFALTRAETALARGWPVLSLSLIPGSVSTLQSMTQVSETGNS